jgi:beta-lactamase regulating signal transducer with metallopeptidase domain
MIASVMLYMFAMSALIGVGALTVERGFAANAWPRRGVWLMAMVLSLGLPMFAMATGARSNSAPPGATGVAAPASNLSFAAANNPVGSLATKSRSARLAGWSTYRWPLFPKLDSALVYCWVLLSSGVLSLFLVGWIRLRSALRRWPATSVHGTQVRVSDNTGPAVLGFLRPQIILPRWLLTTSPSTREIVIAHEREHVSARDPMSLLLSLCVVAAAPWNPLMWWQLRRLRFAIEVDCDARVLRRNVDVALYGETLLSVGQHSSRVPVGAMGLRETVSRLEQRIRIMTTTRYRFARLLAFSAASLSISCVVAAAQLDAPLAAYATLAKLADIDYSAGSQAAGHRINLRLKDADVRDVLSILTHDRAQNVYINSRIGAKVSVDFENTTADEALDIVVREQRLVKRIEGNSIFIDPAPSSSPAGGSASYSSALHTGEHVDLHMKDVDIRTILRTLADIAHQNIIVSQRVLGTTNADFTDTPWDAALDTLLRANGLVQHQEGNIVFIDVASSKGAAR